MNPDQFQQDAHRLVDWISDFRRRIEQQPVRARVAPGDVRRSLPRTPPEQPEPFDSVLSDLDTIVVPGITQVQHPMHFGWFPSNASLASVLGDITSAGLGTLGISWESCPALTEVEEVVCDWMRQLTGLSAAWEGTIHDTASTACTTAMILARERATDLGASRGGLQEASSALVVYTTEEAHSSVKKAALLAGFGADNVRNVPMAPATRSMRPDALQEMIDADLAAGAVPAMLVASVGSTGITAMDPVEDLGRCAVRNGLWFHVDAAMAGSAMLLPECRHLWQGVERADSLAWNPHKWMGTILDCSLFYVRDPEHLIRVMSTNPSYLRSSVDGEVVQYRDWGIPLGRRFRALKLWFHLRLDGADAIRARIRRDLENARWLADQVEAEPYWSLAAPLTLQTVCILHQPEGLDGDALNEHTLAWVDAINRSGAAFLSPARLDGRWIVRVSIGVESTDRHHVAALWRLLREAAANTAPAASR